MIKVMLAEDHQIVRYGIKKILETAGQFDVIGEASNGNDVLQMIGDGVFPDIILADMNMSGMTGIELAEKLKETPYNTIKLVLLTMLDNENFVFQAFSSGIRGYLLKNISTEELLFALSHIYHYDNQYLCTALAVRMLKQAHNMKADHTPIDFSKRETEVLALIAQGYTNKEIADKLFTSRRTVEGHRKTMINKANVRNSAELIRFAVKHSLVD
jgi:DNA-binding NarL/FixJ family response regulator